ncbi:MAG TPA: aspartate ammonia-lyase [archaeon]|nr:aspartate ammonia-lyase [archaeon]
MKYRFENDSLGPKKVPSDAYRGIFTERALENFQISRHKGIKEIFRAYIKLKIACAKANSDLNLLSKPECNAIIKACDEALYGKFDSEFSLDVFQAGAGTAYNMNVNEVIANRANELLKKPKGKYFPVHPNNHVNLGQSSNDLGPSAIKLMVLEKLPFLLRELISLQKSFEKKSKQFNKIKKSGRTHLQDAVPVTLGQEFKAYSENLKKHFSRIRDSEKFLKKIPLGGTATGTGLNSHPKFRQKSLQHLRRITKINFESAHLMENQMFSSDFYVFSSLLSVLCVDLNKICNDLNLLSSGPNTGLNEISFPEAEPGSSIMPGKVNPSICEATQMACFYVIGLNHSIELSSQAGQLELNVFTPLIAYCLSDSLEVLSNALRMFNNKVVSGIKANKEICEQYFLNSLGLATILNPLIGYSKAAEIFKEAKKRNLSVIEIILEKKLIPEKDLEILLNYRNSTSPNLDLINKLKK